MDLRFRETEVAEYFLCVLAGLCGGALYFCPRAGEARCGAGLQRAVIIDESFACLIVRMLGRLLET